MISTNSLAAFTQEVARNRPVMEPGATQAASATHAQRAPDARPADSSPLGADLVSQRRLESVPPMPSKPLPRGSLLDLRA